MRVVLDTNTLISALFWGGNPWRVYEAALSREYVLLTSDALLTELENVLARPKFSEPLKAIGRTAESIVTEYSEIAEVVLPSEVPEKIIRDPKDRIVLGCAVGGMASHIVSGDKDLLVLGAYQNIPIVTAATFLNELGVNP